MKSALVGQCLHGDGTDPQAYLLTASLMENARSARLIHLSPPLDDVDRRFSVLNRSLTFVKRHSVGSYPTSKKDDTLLWLYDLGHEQQLPQQAQQQQQQSRRRRRLRLQTMPAGRQLCSPVTPEDDEPCMPPTRSLSSSSSASSERTADSAAPASPCDQAPRREARRARTECRPGQQHQQHQHHHHLQQRRDEHTSSTFQLYPSALTFRRSSLSNVPAAHPTRYLPQSQAVVTTRDDWHISVANRIARQVLMGSDEGELVGKPMRNFIDPAFRALLLERIVHRREQEIVSGDGGLLVCADVLPIVKQDGSKSAASLWLKEKRDTAGQVVYIWILEEIIESHVKVTVDTNGIICTIEENVRELYGYPPCELIGRPLQVLLPSFASERRNADTLHFYGSCTKRGACFPAIVTTDLAGLVRITSLPVITGPMTIGLNGIVKECDASFSKHLFGYSQNQLLTGRKHIVSMLPQLPGLLRALQRDDLLQHGFVLDNLTCRQLLDTVTTPYEPQPPPSQRRLTQAPNGRTLPVFVALHHDGSQFEVQLQIMLLPSDDVGLWVTFDREAAFARFGHTTGSRNSLPAETWPSLPTADKALKMTTHSDLTHLPKLSENTTTDTTTPLPPPSSTTTLPRPSLPLLPSPCVEYSAQTRKSNIDDYDILDDLGQGAYGLVKLAALKHDVNKTKVVIKYVIKSRILVDCWTRDRTLGLVPVEIHILHTLRKIPHANCSEMLDYFEDDDHYYVVMALCGESIDLFEYIELKSDMTETDIRSIFRQVSLGVRHLHDHKIVHRDIKDENVILDEDGSARLIDFGSAAYLKPGRRFETFVGTLDYAAPEILKGQTYEGRPQDIWALGILLYTLVYRENPFYDIDEIMARELRVPFTMSDGSLDLIKQMLNRDVDKRITIHEVLAHPWLTSP